MASQSIQEKIQQAMIRLGNGGRWQNMILFSEDGLPLASFGKSAYSEETLLEYAMVLLQTLQVDPNPMHECVIRGVGRKRLVFRLVQSEDENLLLAAVCSGRKGHYLAMNQLVAEIETIMQ